MKSAFTLTFLLLIYVNVMAQHKSDFDTSTDPQNGSLVLKGEISFGDLRNKHSFSWYDKGRDEYSPTPNTIEYLKQHLDNYDIIVFMGTWCSDSKELIPKFVKTLEVANYPRDKVTIYGVDREKSTKTGVEKQYQITLVPTIILLKDGKEIGRITETVTNSIEADLKVIISGN